MCKATDVLSGPNVVLCAHCKSAVHMTCLTKEYKSKSKGGANNKNSAEWLFDFVSQMNFFYTCPKCIASKTMKGETKSEVCLLQNNVNDIRLKLSEIDVQIKSIQNGMSSLCATSSQLMHSEDNNSATTVTDKTAPLSYAGAAARKDLSEAVKTALQFTIAKQKEDDHAQFAVAIYGLSEEKQDMKKVYEILRSIGSKATVRNLRRIGRYTADAQNADQTRKARPLRVELSSTWERNEILTLCKNLKSRLAKNHPKISIFPWLPSNEVEKMDRLKQRCQDLNSNLTDGGQSYVIRSGRLVLKDGNGKIRNVNLGKPQLSNASGNGKAAVVNSDHHQQVSSSSAAGVTAPVSLSAAGVTVPVSSSSAAGDTVPVSAAGVTAPVSSSSAAGVTVPVSSSVVSSCASSTNNNVPKNDRRGSHVTP